MAKDLLQSFLLMPSWGKSRRNKVWRWDKVTSIRPRDNYSSSYETLSYTSEMRNRKQHVCSFVEMSMSSFFYFFIMKSVFEITSCYVIRNGQFNYCNGSEYETIIVLLEAVRLIFQCCIITFYIAIKHLCFMVQYLWSSSFWEKWILWKNKSSNKLPFCVFIGKMCNRYEHKYY